jgi:hypothetical protein
VGQCRRECYLGRRRTVCGGMHRTSKAAVVAAFSMGFARFGTGCQRNSAGVITCGMALTLVVNRDVRPGVATLPDMVTYHVLAAGTVLWLLASAGTTDSHLPTVLTASLTAGALLLNRMVRSRREKL